MALGLESHMLDAVFGAESLLKTTVTLFFFYRKEHVADRCD